MKYFELLGLTHEPFSNSPDPRFFYNSRNHDQCLQRLRNGLDRGSRIGLCLGEVGSGKSTLCRALIQLLDEQGLATHLIIDPAFSGPREFLAFLFPLLLGKNPPEQSENASKNLIPTLMAELERSFPKQRAILIMDEGQKLSPACLELLFMLLEPDTATSRRLQVIVFAQGEFSQSLQDIPGLPDMIDLSCRLVPLGFRETRALIRHRLSLAGATREFFTRSAYRAIFRATRGHPRKIMHLGHHVIMSMIITNRVTAGRSIVEACVAQAAGHPLPRSSAASQLLAACAFSAILVFPTALDRDITRQSLPPSGFSSYRAHVIFPPPFPPGDVSAMHDQTPASTNEVGLDIPTAPDRENEPLRQTVESTKEAGKATTDPMYYVQVGAFQISRYAEQTLARFQKFYPNAGVMWVEFQENLIRTLDSMAPPCEEK